MGGTYPIKNTEKVSYEAIKLLNYQGTKLFVQCFGSPQFSIGAEQVSYWTDTYLVNLNGPDIGSGGRMLFWRIPSVELENATSQSHILKGDPRFKIFKNCSNRYRCLFGARLQVFRFSSFWFPKNKCQQLPLYSS